MNSFGQVSWLPPVPNGTFGRGVLEWQSKTETVTTALNYLYIKNLKKFSNRNLLEAGYAGAFFSLYFIFSNFIFSYREFKILLFISLPFCYKEHITNIKFHTLNTVRVFNICISQAY